MRLGLEKRPPAPDCREERWAQRRAEAAAIVAAAGPRPGAGSEEDPGPGPEAPPSARPPPVPAPLCPPAAPRPRPAAALRGPPGAKPSRLESRRVLLPVSPAKKTPTRRGGDWLQVTQHSQDPGPEPRMHPSSPATPRPPRGAPASVPLPLSKCRPRPRSQGRASAVAVWASLLDKSPAPSGFFKLPFLAEPSQAPLSGL